MFRTLTRLVFVAALLLAALPVAAQDTHVASGPVSTGADGPAWAKGNEGSASHAINALYASYGVLQGLDMYSTVTARQHGAVEANPMMAGSYSRGAAVKVLMAATTIAAVRVIESQRLPLEHVVSHQLPLERVADAITALNGDYRLDGRTAIKIAIAPNGTVP